MVNAYVPDRGHIVMLHFSPQAGREQAGTRPGLVLSPAIYNERSGLMLVCPITSREKGYPFEVRLPTGLGTRGMILTDHLKSVDWRVRDARFVEAVPPVTLQETLEKLVLLLQ
jgi:mRNA interferase MazF